MTVPLGNVLQSKCEVMIMKLKEVCEKTGLSKKTIRFYEEKQLIFPEVQYQNGRNFREYSQKNVDDLLEIATLRKALFSIEDIYIMQQDPEEIPAILSAHSRRIKELYDNLKFLNHTIEQIIPEELTGVSDLAKELSNPTKQLPLPSYDLRTRFKMLDLVEAEEQIRLQQDYEHRHGESPFFLEQQKFTNRLGLFNEHYKHNIFLSAGSSNFPKPAEPKSLRYVNLILSGMILMLTLTIFYFLLQHKIELVELWHSIKGWVIPLDLGLIMMRLLTSLLYGMYLRIRHNMR